MIWGALGFGILALVGLLAARRPKIFARYFLAEWQRQRIDGNWDALAWTGWGIFGCSAFTAFMILISDALHK